MPLDKTILKKKVFGIPVPILAVGGGVVGIIVYRKFGPGASGGASGSDDPTAAGAASDFASENGAGYEGNPSGGGGGGGSFMPPGSSTDGLYPQPLVNIRQVIRRKVFVRKNVNVHRTVQTRYRPGRGARPRTTVRNRTVTKFTPKNTIPQPRRALRSRAVVHRGPGNNSRPVGAAPPILRNR